MAKTKQEVSTSHMTGTVFTCAREGGTISVRIGGDIDHHIAAQLRRQLDEMICQDSPCVLRMDLSAITFMDSSGLGLIMGRYALLGRFGAELVLVKPSAPVARMLRLAAMERFIRIEE